MVDAGETPVANRPPDGGRATIVDVARAAGVSTSTVSHVVNGTRRVTEATRRKVQKALDATGYTQDASARAMRRSRTDSIGLVVSDSGEPAFRDMVTGIEAVASEEGFVLLLADSGEDPQAELRAVQVLQSRRVDALILARASGSVPAAVDRPRELGTPVVLMDRLDGVGVDQVGVEGASATRTLVAHLIDQGHRRIGIVAGDLAVATLRERLEGYRSALAAAGIEVDTELVWEGDGSAEDARRLVSDRMARADRPTALLTASSPMTVGALRALDDQGLSVPEDVAMVAFDTLPNADLMRTSLTAAGQPAVSVGREAMGLVLRRLRQPDAPPLTVRLNAEIEHGASCGCGRPEGSLGG
ncbi:LacI family DNA-binding transcriptional regulator [Ruania halotolerans]|uniref:LacI family DNA-binding transcriptional regulator n=1 Tax=Ruania halotolerans TaxID=2897773 RepID=UPI001E3A47B1|nr:LacI family DNA-binding transcriptional regulator [Ruania halotolerans]UFU06359.1 LacI family transcriptional regulator [Ruania halotolerans]